MYIFCSRNELVRDAREILEIVFWHLKPLTISQATNNIQLWLSENGLGARAACELINSRLALESNSHRKFKCIENLIRFIIRK